MTIELITTATDFDNIDEFIFLTSDPIKIFWFFFFNFCSIIWLQVRGHQRNASDTKEFHEVTKRDALMHFELELKTLLNTINNDELRHYKNKEMERFAALFGRFLQEEGPSVEWDKIQKLPADAVKDYATLSAPKDNEAVSIIDITSSKINKWLSAT